MAEWDDFPVNADNAGWYRAELEFTPPSVTFNLSATDYNACLLGNLWEHNAESNLINNKEEERPNY